MPTRVRRAAPPPSARAPPARPPAGPASVPALLARRPVPPIGRGVRVVGSVGTALAGWWALERRTPASRRGLARRLRRSFEGLGSTYVKLGQIVSAFEGLFPDELVSEF